MTACKPREIWTKSGDCINVNFMAVITCWFMQVVTFANTRKTKWDTRNLWALYCIIIFMALPAAYEIFQARGQIKAIVSSLATATTITDLRYTYDLHHSSQQHQILNLRCKARDRTGSLMDTSWVHNHQATKGTPLVIFWNSLKLYNYFNIKC